MRVVLVVSAVFIVYAFFAVFVSQTGHPETYTLWHPQGIIIAIVACLGIGAGMRLADEGCPHCRTLEAEVSSLRDVLTKDVP
jgi:hypothetical protein